MMLKYRSIILIDSQIENSYENDNLEKYSTIIVKIKERKTEL